eukprot:3674318-Rhodomonas_salina.2
MTWIVGIQYNCTPLPGPGTWQQWEYNSSYSPTSRRAAVCAPIVTSVHKGLKLFQWDVQCSSCTLDVDTEIYMQALTGYPLPPGQCLRLSTSIYGLGQSSALFFENMERWMLDYGFKAVGPGWIMFCLDRGTEKLIDSLYVDDNLFKKYMLSARGKPLWYLGVTIDHDLEKGISTMGQEHYIEMLLDLFDMTECIPAITPSDLNLCLLKSHSPAVPNAADTKYFQQIIGNVCFNAHVPRHSLLSESMCQARSRACQANPGPEHILAAKRILRYFKGTKHLKLTYRRQTDGSGNVLVSYADLDHAGDHDTCHSVSGCVLMLTSAAISWQSVWQQVTALSTAEAEYYAASVAGTDVTCMHCMLGDLGYEQLAPTVLWEDKKVCIYMSQTSGMYHKADTRVYHLRELCKAGTMVLEKVSSAEQVADSLTKSTPRPAFVQHRDAMIGIDTSNDPGFGTSTEQWRTGDKQGDDEDEAVVQP